MLNLVKRTKYITRIFLIVILCYISIDAISKTSSQKEMKNNFSQGYLKKSTDLKTEQKKLQKPIRKPNQIETITCTDHFKNKYHIGMVSLSTSCESTPSIYCSIYSESIKNYCDKHRLIRYYCDSESKEKISTKTIHCENGCKNGACNQYPNF